MGVTGAGKSSFTKLVTGDGSVKIGHGQESETKGINSHDVSIYGRTFTLVDSPGFDDLHLKDSDVLKMLVDWLTSTYRSAQKLNGILYLHRLTDARMRGSSLRNFKMFQELIGEQFHPNVTLGTACWSLVPFSTAVDRETELKTSSSFWKIMISKGARLERIPDDVERARRLVWEIANHDAIPLQTQTDIVDLGKSFDSLQISKMVDYKLEEVLREQEKEKERLREAEIIRIAEERALELGPERVRARQSGILEYQRKKNSCEHKTPYGICDRDGCTNKLQRFKCTFHCCSCYPNDDFWYCGPCGNTCRDSEHPEMSRIFNSDGDDCVIL